MINHLINSVLLTIALLYSAPLFAKLFDTETFTDDDAILVVDSSGQPVYSWQAEKAMIPASLSKLATAYLAIDKWGLAHEFVTEFSLRGDELWVKGFGDPFLVSEELDVVTQALAKQLSVIGAPNIRSIHIDSTHFSPEVVPGSSTVTDPYNAPMSAVSANFNTVMLSKMGGRVISAEPQTPLTQTAIMLGKNINKKGERVNLISPGNAQRHFAELLLAKLGWANVEVQLKQRLPKDVSHVYSHHNSHRLDDVLRGTLEFSNNFMANQVFLLLSGVSPATFAAASTAANQRLSEKLGWTFHFLQEGAGLSRSNRLSAAQINDLLGELNRHKSLLKKVNHPLAQIRAKTGTLDGVRSYAGYIDLPKTSYQFVFIFNRKVPWRHRELMLERLVDQLVFR